MRIAVMQPYFYPYLNYFRLIAAVDLFVLFDCVQFPRRGRVHRAPLPPAGGGGAGRDAAGGGGWLTLPLARQPQATAIRDIRLAGDRDVRWRARCAALPWLSAGPLAAAIAAPLPDRLLPLLEAHLARACGLLGIATPLRRSSALGLDPALKGQDRVLAVARHFGATAYWNLPGGRALYDPAAFDAAGLALHFLPAYEGPHMSMLHALSTLPSETLHAALRAPGGDTGP